MSNNLTSSNIRNFLSNIFNESGIMNIINMNCNNFTACNVDKKTIEMCLKLLEKCLRLCQNTKLNLKNSPPYLLGTINDLQSLVNNIQISYKDKMEELLNILYFKVMIITTTDKAEQLIKNFKDGKDKIFDTRSPYRKKLSKLSLILAHVFKTFNELFNSGIYCPDNFRITKSDAGQWWKDNFDDKTVVSWTLFFDTLSKSYKINEVSQNMALQTTINLCCNNFVTIFEFDVFVRLFQPWNNILETWKALAVVHPGYMAFITYDDVKAMLIKFIDFPGPGTFVFRSSCTKLGQWAIGYITIEKKILQTIIQNKSLARALLDGEKEGCYIYPNGITHFNGYNDLYSLVHNLTQTSIQVSHEQYKVYCEMDSTFELCKICSEKDKNVRLEPCQHLLCKSCLISWQASSGDTCPFCRLKIKSMEEIIVKPYTDLYLNKIPPLPPRSTVNPLNIKMNPDYDESILNYVSLEFNDNKCVSKEVQVDSSELLNNDYDHNFKLLIECDLIDEKVAKLILNVTDNNLNISRKILKYFELKNDISL